MHLHPLDPSMKCLQCGKGDLVFIRTRAGRDLYRCVADVPCKPYTVHARRGRACGICEDNIIGIVSPTWIECAGREPAKRK